MGEKSGAIELWHCTNLASPWPDLKIDRSKGGCLANRIVAGITHMVSEQKLRIGTKMPSVRQFARWFGVSTFTAVAVYNRLVIFSFLSSRRRSGVFVTPNEAARPQQCATSNTPLTRTDALTPTLYSGTFESVAVGTGRLPPERFGEATILDAVRQAIRMPSSRLKGYGHTLGFPSLRQHRASPSSDDMFAVDPNQILLTHDATHAFDLILRTLAKAGDCVLV